MYIVDGLKRNILYDSSDMEGLQKNVLYQSADTDYKPPAPNAEYAEVVKIPKKPSTSSTSEYAEVQKPNAVYAQVDPKTQQKNLKAKKQKGEVLKLILICIYVHLLISIIKSDIVLNISH